MDFCGLHKSVVVGMTACWHQFCRATKAEMRGFDYANWWLSILIAFCNCIYKIILVSCLYFYRFVQFSWILHALDLGHLLLDWIIYSLHMVQVHFILNLFLRFSFSSCMPFSSLSHNCVKLSKTASSSFHFQVKKYLFLNGFTVPCE